MKHKITSKQLHELANKVKQNIKEQIGNEKEMNIPNKMNDEEIENIDQEKNNEKPQEILSCVKSLQDANDQLMQAKANVQDPDHKEEIAKLRKKIARIWDQVVDKYDIVK